MGNSMIHLLNTPNSRVQKALAGIGDIPPESQKAEFDREFGTGKEPTDIYKGMSELDKAFLELRNM